MEDSQEQAVPLPAQSILLLTNKKLPAAFIRRLKESSLGYMFLLPSLVLFGLFLFYPLVQSIYLSLHLTDPRGRVAAYVGLDNFTDLLSGEPFWNSLTVTILFTLLTVPTGIIFGILTAALTHAKLPGMRVFQFIFSMPLAMSVSTSAVIWAILFHPTLGVLNYLLTQFGLMPVQWLTNPSTALLSIALMTVWMQSGLNYIIVLSGLQGISMQTFIDADNYDLSQLEPNITNYYTFEGKLNSMPFNTSNPILYYNKDMFKKAGLDPNKAPSTFEEVKEAAAKLTASGQGGAGFAIYGWFMEQWFADQGAEYINNGNGRTATATESLLNQPTGVSTLSWWKEMIDDKLAVNLGLDTADTKKAFLAGQIGMTLDSTAGLRGIVDAAQGKFEVGTGFLPKAANASEGGVVVGGASLWILNNKPTEEQQAAWDFIKYLTQPSVQANWHVSTGYFPITKKAYDEPIVAQNLAKYPQFQTAVDQLHASKPSTASTGAVMGIFPEARQIVESAIEETLTGVKAPQQAFDDGAKAITDKLGVYHKTVN